MSNFILASGSPRRRELLDLLGLDYIIAIPDIDESPLPHESPSAMVARLALAKAATVAARHSVPEIVLAADTIVTLDGAILGQPSGEREARAMLGSLQGRSHTVLTGVAVNDDVAVVSAAVEMAPMSASEIRWYVATGEPLDKAGGYGLQGIGGAFVERIEGSHSTVVGLPLVETIALLRRAGITVAGRP